MNDKTGAELVFLPLGGCGEIGMNLNAYGYGPAHDRRWILVDVGVTFGDNDTPGIELIAPDTAFFEEQDARIEAIFLTHAHEDHIGALALLLPRLQTRAPIYATAFTAWLAQAKLADRGQKHVTVETITPGTQIKAGPFVVRYITLTHSIPEANALALETPLGTILHTGDWKIDPKPQLGDTTDIAALRQLGDDGLLAMVCDSTNVFVEGESGSEGTVRQNMISLVAGLKGRIVVTAFASNVARVASVVEAARLAGRKVCLLGRSMHKITQAAVETGVINTIPSLVSEEKAGQMPRDSILFLCTGSQGESRAALSRISRGENRHVSLGEGDTVIFSSRVIPGNEKAIFNLYKTLAGKNVRIITEETADTSIHVSGHPCRDELRRMYQWTRPKIAIPVHGEPRHITEHATYAKTLKIKHAIPPHNGDLVRLAPGPAHIIDNVVHGRLHLDGCHMVPAESEGLKQRRHLAQSGHIGVCVAIDDDGIIVDGPVITAHGLCESDGRAATDSLTRVEQALDNALGALGHDRRMDDETVEQALKRTTSTSCRKIFGRKPVVAVSVLRV